MILNDEHELPNDSLADSRFFFVCLYIYTATAQAFLPPIQITAKISMYQTIYDDNGNPIGEQPVEEYRLPLRSGSKAVFANVPGLDGYFTFEEVDLDHGLPKFTVQYIFGDEMVDCRHFHCVRNNAAHSFSCVTGAANQEWRLEKDIFARVVVNIRELPRQQGFSLW